VSGKTISGFRTIAQDAAKPWLYYAAGCAPRCICAGQWAAKYKGQFDGWDALREETFGGRSGWA
jgi:hypothetical protein